MSCVMVSGDFASETARGEAAIRVDGIRAMVAVGYWPSSAKLPAILSVLHLPDINTNVSMSGSSRLP